jgi:hypothetical protein
MDPKRGPGRRESSNEIVRRALNTRYSVSDAGAKRGHRPDYRGCPVQDPLGRRCSSSTAFGRHEKSLGGRMCYSPQPEDDLSYCGVFEGRSLENALGATCARSGTARCADCGTTLCSHHSERCTVCSATFCPSCSSSHQREHAMPVSPDRKADRHRKSA